MSPKLRFGILSRDAFTCQYCGARAPHAELQVDHIHPRSMGGGDDERNLVASCQLCNIGKGARKLRRGWRCEPEYALAGRAIEELLERFGSRCSAAQIYEVIQEAFADGRPDVLSRARAAESFEQFIDEMNALRDAEDAPGPLQ